jgi:hypothetical protein
MATITDVNDNDLITTSNEVINANFDNLNTDKIETSYLDTDTTLAANSDTKIATQKAVKAYVDSGGNPNASTTSKGVVEEATQAEVDAGTAAGATTARLFLNPSTVSASETTAGLVEEATDAEVTAGTATGGTTRKLFVTPAKLATNLASKIKTATISVSSAEIKALISAPKELIPAPGTGLMNVIDDIIVSYDYGSVAYTGGAALRIVEATSGTVLSWQTLTQIQMNGTNDLIIQAYQNAVSTYTSNKAIQLTTASSEFADGNGTMKVYIAYHIITL